MRIACRLVTSSMTSRDYDVILVTSQSSNLSHLETRSRTRINYPRGPFKHTLVKCLKNQLIRLTTMGEKHLA